MLRRRASARPHLVAYEGHGGGCSYAELDLRARAVAARLGVGLPPGDRVLLAYPRGTDLAGAFYGCLYAGMVAVPLVLGAGGADAERAVPGAVRRLRPAVVLTGGDAWTALAVDRARTAVVEADGTRVGGTPTSRLADGWSPVGVLRTASAYQRYVTDGLGGGRLEPALSHGALSDVIAELARAERLSTAQDGLGWIASVHGLDEAVWRILLPVQRGV
jgi:non-ribosomal peptide synthetase component F